MTPFVPFPMGAQVQLLMSYAGIEISNRLWFLNRQPPTTQEQLDNLSMGCAAWYNSQVLPFLSNELLFRGTIAQSWDSFPPPLTSSVAVAALGGQLAKALSANVAIRVVFQGDSSQTFRKNSNFVPGIPVDQVVGNNYSPAIGDAIFEAYVSLIDLAPLMGPFPAWEWRVTSSWLSNLLRSTQSTARTDFISLPSPKVSQRRKRLTD